MMKYENSMIKGHLDIHFSLDSFDENQNDDLDHEILIHGDPEGLRSLAMILIDLADYDHENDSDIPKGARHHLTLNPKIDLSSNSQTTTIGRLDAKSTGVFYSKFKPR